jgi:hypothetical protein
LKFSGIVGLYGGGRGFRVPVLVWFLHMLWVGSLYDYTAEVGFGSCKKENRLTVCLSEPILLGVWFGTLGYYFLRTFRPWPLYFFGLFSLGPNFRLAFPSFLVFSTDLVDVADDFAMLLIMCCCEYFDQFGI